MGILQARKPRAVRGIREVRAMPGKRRWPLARNCNYRVTNSDTGLQIRLRPEPPRAPQKHSGSVSRVAEAVAWKVRGRLHR